MEWLKPRMDGYCPAGRGIMKPLLHPQMQGGGDSGLLGKLCCGWDVVCTSSCEIYEPPGQHQSSPFPCCLVPFSPSEEELQLSEQTPPPPFLSVLNVGVWPGSGLGHLVVYGPGQCEGGRPLPAQDGQGSRGGHRGVSPRFSVTPAPAENSGEGGRGSGKW